MLAESVAVEGYDELCEVFRRKPDDRRALAYATYLADLTDDQFRDAVRGVIEGENTFPSVATLLKYGRAASRALHQKGVPHIRGGMRLADVFDRLHHEEHVPAPHIWSHPSEELIFEDAVNTEPAKGEDEPSLNYVRRIAEKATGEVLRLRTFERGDA